MHLLQSLHDLFRHMTWADAEVWRSVLAFQEAQNDSRLRKLLHHIHLTQHAFYKIWCTLPMEFPEASDFPNLAAIAEWGREYHRQAASYLDKVGESDLNATVAIPWAERFVSRFGKLPESTTLAETMLQVTAHSTYHRGQVNARLRELGAEPPLVDFIAWIWFGRPKPNWPESGE